MRDIKTWLVPHHGNHYQPHLLRPFVLVAVLAMVLVTQLSWNLAANGHGQVLGYQSRVHGADLVILTNQERQKVGLPALAEDSRLTAAARLKATDMLEHQYWAHVSSDGTEPWSFFARVGYNYRYAGENLARDFLTSHATFKAWMDSPTHRDNILNPDFQEVGFATMTGRLNGRDTTLVVAHYGTPPLSRVTFGGFTLPRELTAASAQPSPVSGSNPGISTAEAPGTPLFVSGNLGWGQILGAAPIVALIPSYIMTHLAMLRLRLHVVSRWLWRRRLLELGLLCAVLLSILLAHRGSII